MRWLVTWSSRALNALRLAGLHGHRRRVRRSRHVLREIRRWRGDDVHARLFGYMRRLDPLVFEEVVLTALEDGGRLVLRNRAYTGDQGIDGWVRLSGFGWVPLQVKRFKSHVDNRAVEALGEIVRVRACAAGLFVHTGRSGTGVYRHLRSGRVVLISGQRLVDLLLRGVLEVRRRGPAPVR